MSRADKVSDRRLRVLALSTVVSRQDEVALRTVARHEDVSLGGLVRLALDAYLAERKLPPLTPLRGWRRHEEER
jgi:hypothetical protein